MLTTQCQTIKNGGISSLRVNMNLLSSPTIEYCEKPIQGLIKRPYYALSNLAFLFSGLLILYKGKMNRLAKIFGFTAITIGILSFFYDASYLYISQLFDLAGMLLFVNILIFLNIKSLRKTFNNLIWFQILAFTASMAVIIIIRGFTGNVVFGSYVLAVVISEYLLYRNKTHLNHKYWILAFGLFVLGFAIWLLDESKTLCFSFGLLNGRAVFHYLNAISIYYLYIFYDLNSARA